MACTRDVEAALARYKRSIEDLTFNSKPLIDDLTRAAGQLEPKGDQIIEIIRSRIMQVAKPEAESHVVNGLYSPHYVLYPAASITICSFYYLLLKLLFYAISVLIIMRMFSSSVMNLICCCRFVQSGSCLRCTSWIPS